MDDFGAQCVMKPEDRMEGFVTDLGWVELIVTEQGHRSSNILLSVTDATGLRDWLTRWIEGQQ